jgi:hypothetical protein
MFDAEILVQKVPRVCGRPFRRLTQQGAQLLKNAALKPLKLADSSLLRAI